jgi:DNA-binding response OmpR family regulator
MSRASGSSFSPTVSAAEPPEAGLESGCTDFVTKPVDSLELLAKVRSCLGEA